MKITIKNSQQFALSLMFLMFAAPLYSPGFMESIIFKPDTPHWFLYGFNLFFIWDTHYIILGIVLLGAFSLMYRSLKFSK